MATYGGKRLTYFEIRLAESNRNNEIIKSSKEGTVECARDSGIPDTQGLCI